MKVDWPHKSETKSSFPPKGYAFLIFERENSVQDLMSQCAMDKEKFYICISSSSIKDKPVQIRPWRLNDTDCIYDNLQPFDPRKTIFVGGVPRPLKSSKYFLFLLRNSSFKTSFYPENLVFTSRSKYRCKVFWSIFVTICINIIAKSSSNFTLQLRPAPKNLSTKFVSRSSGINSKFPIKIFSEIWTVLYKNMEIFRHFSVF